LNRSVEEMLRDRGLPTSWRTLAELDGLAERWIDELRSARAERATGLAALAERFDRFIRTDENERIDDPDVSDDRKAVVVAALHRQNLVLQMYQRFRRAIRPYVEWTHQRFDRPARVLELAAGSGEFSRYLARRDESPSIEVTCTDVVQRYVDDAAERASDLPMQCMQLDAADMSKLEDDAFDVGFIGQAIHHFSPGLLARVIAEAGRVCRAGFVAADGKRGPMVALGITGFAAMTEGGDFLHDAVISARRFYSEPELEVIARLAAPKHDVRVGTRFPSLTILEVDRRSEGAGTR